MLRRNLVSLGEIHALLGMLWRNLKHGYGCEFYIKGTLSCVPLIFIQSSLKLSPVFEPIIEPNKSLDIALVYEGI